MYIPPSYQYNNYGYGGQPAYGRPGYGPNPPYYQNQQQPPYYQNQPTNPTNQRYNRAQVQSAQPLLLDLALEQSSYPTYNREFIQNYIINDYLDNQEAKVYFQSGEKEKTFVIEYTLSITFANKPYKINLIIHIPVLFPNHPPEFFVQKRPNTGINNIYLENQKIDSFDFKININKFLKYDPNRNNIKEIIDNIKREFNSEFPIYRDKKKQEQELFGKNNLDKNKVNEVIVKTDTFTDGQLLEFMRKQVKDIIRSQYYNFNQKYKIENNNQELKHINDILKIKAGKADISSNPMNQELEKLRYIKDELNQIENNLQNELQQMQNSCKSAFEKCEEFIKIKDQKDLEYAVMEKTIEDYLVYLKKGYEKKIINFNEMVEQTRSLSREIFSINYLRKQRQNGYY